MILWRVAYFPNSDRVQLTRSETAPDFPNAAVPDLLEKEHRRVGQDVGLAQVHFEHVQRDRRSVVRSVRRRPLAEQYPVVLQVEYTIVWNLKR